LCLLPFADGGRKGSTGVALMSNFDDAENESWNPDFAPLHPGWNTREGYPTKSTSELFQNLG